MLKPNSNEYHKTRLTGKELALILFGKKKCPQCGLKMRRNDIKEHYDKGNVFIGEGSNGTTFLNVDKFEVKIAYRCSNCDKRFTLSELTSLSKETR
ncbi:hypothetical protein [Aneurinibacillus tyrosinisolvens]|uniref:hypothetical protein n=1 Tax=Aneurinibacillus tyrosinisolvens TaxID=1443435 RepID=UPI00063F9649|nr:hypothetical protein [Aneurinibacillus tyrosinisolvens]